MTYAPHQVVLEGIYAVGRQIGGRNGNLAFMDTDFSAFLALPEAERRRLVPDMEIDINDAAASFAYNAPEVLGLQHAFADQEKETRIIGYHSNTLGQRLYTIVENATNELYESMLYCNEPAADCIRAIENVQNNGDPAASLLAFRHFEAEIKKAAETSTASTVGLPSSDRTQYDAATQRFQRLMAQSGFSVMGAKSPDSIATRFDLEVLEADTLLPVPEREDTYYRTYLGGVAYLLHTGNDEVERDWWSVYRPIVMSSLTEEQAAEAWEDFLHIQYEGYKKKSEHEPGDERAWVSDDYRDRMRKLCTAWLPEVFALAVD